MEALDEIYKIQRLLHRSDLQISAEEIVGFFQNEYAFSKCWQTCVFQSFLSHFYHVYYQY